jgi:hypothetical protein
LTPGEALEWLRTLQVADELKTRPLVESFQTFIAESAEAGAEWLLQQPVAPARDEMVLALCHCLPPEHAAIAQAWAQTISDPQLREEALQFLAQ